MLSPRRVVRSTGMTFDPSSSSYIYIGSQKTEGLVGDVVISPSKRCECELEYKNDVFHSLQAQSLCCSSPRHLEKGTTSFIWMRARVCLTSMTFLNANQFPKPVEQTSFSCGISHFCSIFLSVVISYCIQSFLVSCEWNFT